MKGERDDARRHARRPVGADRPHPGVRLGGTASRLAGLACAAVLLAAGPIRAADPPPKRLTVLDADANVVSVVASAPVLLELGAQLAARVATGETLGRGPAPAFRYRLDLATAAGGERWLYDPTGRLVRPGVADAPIHRLPEPAAFNRLAGVPAR